jgi:hypothetical protein
MHVLFIRDGCKTECRRETAVFISFFTSQSETKGRIMVELCICENIHTMICLQNHEITTSFYYNYHKLVAEIKIDRFNELKKLQKIMKNNVQL